MDPDRGESFGVCNGNDDRRSTARRQTGDVGAGQINRVCALNVPRQTRDQRRLVCGAALIFGTKSVPAFLRLGRGVLGWIGDHTA